MFNRFGPFEIFSIPNHELRDLSSVLKDIQSIGEDSRASIWKVFSSHTDSILQVAEWVQRHADRMVEHFPRTKSKLIYKNRHLLIKEFQNLKNTKGKSLGSRGFEGSNLRLVIASNAERNLSCAVGEYLNLSGNLLPYRPEYPTVDQCEICIKQKPKEVCSICGRWACKKCGLKCEQCGNWICSVCNNTSDDNHSPHYWYFHR
jgi:hypothetical protein